MQDYFRKTIKMNIQLLSISHKTARASLRGRFVFDSEQTKDILKQLTEPDGQQENTGIEEAVLISTSTARSFIVAEHRKIRILSECSMFF